MSNEEKTVKYMLAKPVLAEAQSKFDELVFKVANKVHMDFLDLMLAFTMDNFIATARAAKDMGTRIDLEGWFDTVREMYNMEVSTAAE